MVTGHGPCMDLVRLNSLVLPGAGDADKLLDFVLPLIGFPRVKSSSQSQAAKKCVSSMLSLLSLLHTLPWDLSIMESDTFHSRR